MIKVFTIYKDVKDMKGVKCPGEGKSLEKILNEKVLSCKINEKNILSVTIKYNSNIDVVEGQIIERRD